LRGGAAGIGPEIGIVDSRHILLLLVYALMSMTFAQLLWIWGAGSLVILLASFHMNAVPFYVMVIVVLSLGGEWSWMQALGAALVAAGVMVSQSAMYRK
jgi:drug/metabolite transporter (DMT)-like permease